MSAFSHYVTLFILRELQLAVKTFCARQDTCLTSAPNSGLWTVCLILLDCQNWREEQKLHCLQDTRVIGTMKSKSSTRSVEISPHGTKKKHWCRQSDQSSGWQLLFTCLEQLVSRAAANSQPRKLRLWFSQESINGRIASTAVPPSLSSGAHHHTNSDMKP